MSLHNTIEECENIVLYQMPVENDIQRHETEEDNHNELVRNFINVLKKINSDIEKDFKHYLDNPISNLLKAINKKYPHLKRQRLTKRTRKIEAKAYIHEILENPEYSKYLENFTRQDKKNIYRYCIKKIRGVYKHAQALKTGFCNLQIINGLSEENTISICITRNTLEANEQWLQRLYKELDNRYPHIKLNDKIMIISSKKNDLGGNATHCKDINAAWKLLKRENNFKIIFICSNKIRISDALEISEDFQNLNLDLQKNIRVFHDEAHNLKEGIPAFRHLIENIIIQPNVLSYTPITASNNPIFDEENPLWQKANVENWALDYTNFDKTKSTNPHFSSCNKAIRISLETLKNNPKWLDYDIKKIPKDTFIKVHQKEINTFIGTLKTYDLDNLTRVVKKQIELFTLDKISTNDFDVIDILNNMDRYSEGELIEIIIMVNVERRRTLEFCEFMKHDKEIEAVNNGLNCLNMNELLGFDYYTNNVFNIYILSTPNRRIVTRYLCEEAIKKDFNPIVLGIYGCEGDKYHLMFDNKEYEVSHIMDKGEFNVKLDKLFAYLKEQNVNINRPFIIIGNYNPTGESLTFVNYSYGTVRGNIRLISTNAEEDYQEASRINYMITKFIEKDPNWNMPEKYLIGPKKFIDNALSYEDENDCRIDSISMNSNNNDNSVFIPSFDNNTSKHTGNGITAIPIKITVDTGDTIVKEMIEIIKASPHRTDEKKAEFLSKLKQFVDSGECVFEDKTGKFDFETFIIKTLRGYKRKDNGPEKGVWKFTSYQNHFNIETPFINSKNNMSSGECEILMCVDTYLLKDSNGVEIEKNLKTVWWMGYKY
uniref:Uncharacterized protein n=1 Tax=viral metagenome TaxID=1070528 RepID=A0A6C0JES0_9ZZZZ